LHKIVAHAIKADETEKEVIAEEFFKKAYLSLKMNC